MSRLGIKNKKPKIKYPRVCECGYAANNPSMWAYHQNQHKHISEGVKCEFGCGNLAIYRTTGGKLRCNEKWAKCPKYLEDHADKVKNQWTNADERKEKTKKTFMKYCAGNKQVTEKMIKTKRFKTGLLTEEKRTNYRRYAYACRKLSQAWAKDNGYETGRQTFHVDHKLSILDAFHAELPPSITSHPKNLRILESKKNSSKGSKSIITINELLRSINKC